MGHICYMAHIFSTQDYNSGYLEMINFYKGRLSESDMLDIRPDLDESARKERIFDVCTHAFGMANHFYTTGNKDTFVIWRIFFPPFRYIFRYVLV